MCALCGSKSDYVFPMKMLLCNKCTNDIAERDDVQKLITPHVGVGYCANCGKHIIGGYIVDTHVCHKCSLHLAKMERAYMVRRHARHVI